MVDREALELSDDKLAYIVECFAKDMAPMLNKLRKPYFQQLIYSLIELWCAEYCENVNSCIQQIHDFASFKTKDIMIVNDVTRPS